MSHLINLLICKYMLIWFSMSATTFQQVGTGSTTVIIKHLLGTLHAILITCALVTGVSIMITTKGASSEGSVIHMPGWGEVFLRGE